MRRRHVFWIGLLSYVISFFLVAVVGTGPARGYWCAFYALVMPWWPQSLGEGGIFEGKVFEYLSVLVSGWINPFFLIAAILVFLGRWWSSIARTCIRAKGISHGSSECYLCCSRRRSPEGSAHRRRWMVHASQGSSPGTACRAPTKPSLRRGRAKMRRTRARKEIPRATCLADRGSASRRSNPDSSPCTFGALMQRTQLFHFGFGSGDAQE
jgi:hypothetical protein